MSDMTGAAAKFHMPHTVNIWQYTYRLYWCLALGIFCLGIVFVIGKKMSG